MSSAAVPREQTFLRVKRRRNENPPSTIRLELLGGWNVRRQDEHDVENNNNSGNILPAAEVASNNGYHPYPLRSSSTATLADSRHSGMSTSSSQSAVNNNNSNGVRRTTSAAVWKRVEELPNDPLITREKRCRVVDAIFESDGRSTKRRKLTVLGEAKTDETTSNSTTTPKKSNVYRVLDPTTRLVDDSLLMVHSGDRPVTEHYRFITTDPRVATSARTWMAYTNRGGNLLHACAHWNDVDLAHDLLRQSLPGLADAVDEDGRTPYEVAQLCNHESITEVLEAFGADTTNFVYDMFVPEEIEVETTTAPNGGSGGDGYDNWNPLEKTALDSNSNNPKNNNNKAPEMPTMIDASRLLELQGGVGYWTEEGELILEMEPHHIMGITSEFGHESDEDYDDEVDSNCEDYGGNDYPDEESWEEEFLHEEPQIEGDPFDHAPTSEEYDMW